MAKEIQAVQYIPSEYVNYSQDLRGNLASSNACYRQARKNPARKNDGLAHLNQCYKALDELKRMFLAI